MSTCLYFLLITDPVGGTDGIETVIIIKNQRPHLFQQAQIEPLLVPQQAQVVLLVPVLLLPPPLLLLAQLEPQLKIYFPLYLAQQLLPLQQLLRPLLRDL